MQGRIRAQHVIPDDFCITSEELKLYNLVNKYRQENKLPEIPLSKNLCYVAKLHVNDLHYNRPDTAQCNLHSWSDQGNWTECCYGRDIINNTCMTSKPKELTSYPGQGYEIAFWESVDAIPAIVLDLWKSSEASRELILNRAQWKDKSWKAFGVGILKGYAVVWFGAEPDDANGVRICNSDQIAGKLIDKIQLAQTPDDSFKYYLIIASFKDNKSAQAEVNKYKSRGFRTPSVVQSAKNFRVSLGTYNTQEEAVSAKKSLGEKYQQAWILKQ
ncbi:MAG: SPOR domain-containing protein [Bacteroidales bacterium]